MKIVTLTFCAALLGGCAQQAVKESAAPDAGAASAAAPKVDTRALAATLLKNAAVKEGDIVLISGGVRDWALIEDLSVATRKAGAFPLGDISSEQLDSRVAHELPEKYDSQKPVLGLKMADIADVTISLDYIEHNDLFADIPPARRAARAAAAQPVELQSRKRNVRSLSLGNGLLPTATQASQFGITQDALAKIYWAGVNTDYDKLQAIAKLVGQKLTAGKRVRITNPNGTDLTVDITGRQVSASDGVISDEDIKRGGPGVQVWLPAGEVYVSAVAGTAEGKMVADHYFYNGQTIDKLELTFAHGKLTAMTAAAGLDKLKADYDASGAGKEDFGYIDFGINPDVQIPAGSKMVAFMPSGMVTVGVGNNIWAGGSNSSSYAIAAFQPGSTATIDDKPLVTNGKLVQ